MNMMWSAGRKNPWLEVTLLACALNGCGNEDAASAPAAGGSGGGEVAASGGVAGTAGSPSVGTSASGAAGATATPDTSAAASVPTVGNIADDPRFGIGVPCPAISAAPLIDFTFGAAAQGLDAADAGSVDAGTPLPVPVAATAVFGDFTTTLSGGTYHYPVTGDYPLTSDVTQNDWHLTGNVGTYSGFGIFLAGCGRIDASSYRGFSFTIRGSVGMGDTLTFSVGTASNEITFLWVNAYVPFSAAAPNFGRCIPVTGQYDGSCSAPFVQVPVTETATTITVLWSDLAGGRPAPGVDPAEITSLTWALPAPAGVGTVPIPYEVDLRVDDLQWVP
jgi:hypothetical protein